MQILQVLFDAGSVIYNIFNSLFANCAVVEFMKTLPIVKRRFLIWVCSVIIMDVTGFGYLSF